MDEISLFLVINYLVVISFYWFNIWRNLFIIYMGVFLDVEVDDI